MSTSHPVTDQGELISTFQKSALIVTAVTVSTGAALIILAVSGRQDMGDVGLYLLGVGILTALGAAIMQCVRCALDTSADTREMVADTRDLMTTYDQRIEAGIAAVQRTGRNILLAADVDAAADEFTRRRNHHHN